MTKRMRRIHVSLQDELIRRIDEVAREMGIKRSVTIRLLLLAGLGEWKFEHYTAKWEREKAGLTERSREGGTHAS